MTLYTKCDYMKEKLRRLETYALDMRHEISLSSPQVEDWLRTLDDMQILIDLLRRTVKELKG